MPSPLSIAVSPYHLATREPPAMAALLLADHVVTLLPQPASGASREEIRAAVENCPRYLRLMESWRWSSPLWNAGVISSGVDDDEAITELAGVYDSINREESLAGLRVLTRGAQQRAAESAEKSLDFIAGDMLRGGPDPGINIPIAAAIDRFAARHGMCVARAGASSIAQRAESRLGAKLFSIAIPMLYRAGGGRLLMLRNDLESELASLRAAIVAAVERDETRVSRAVDPAALARIAQAAERYTGAFNSWAARWAKGDDENAERVTSGYASITAMLMPADAVLRSSRAAIEALNGHAAPSRNDSTNNDASRNGDSHAESSPDRVAVLVIREMNLRPA